MKINNATILLFIVLYLFCGQIMLAKAEMLWSQIFNQSPIWESTSVLDMSGTYWCEKIIF